MLLYVRTVHALSRLCGLAAATMIVASVLIVCQLVFMRYVLNASTVWQTEVVVYLMIGATLVGMPYVQLIRGHINVDLLPLYLRTGAPRRRLFVACVVLQAAACGLIAWFAGHLWFEAVSGGWRSESVFGTPLWIPYLAMPLGFGLLVLQYFADLLTAIGCDDPFVAPDKRTPAAQGEN
ncbi:TRAP transporter small permease subunit [Pseudazoarcus pumilus]|uniref:TRAP transporter small permease protein n=1 Tax=Pseudazoarcus pumilus TaxID=2067960 RepID=A0A2I6S7X8_9RHOO|nr:TRAP transporter small permease [Pseudazoarcus pumilus]AUN95364.1 hypothetical protein C0099_10765 [Pseudazoarcus pumilus]